MLRGRGQNGVRERFLIFYGTSDNPHHWWPRKGWDQLGYHPADTAADHQLPTPITDQWHGGGYATEP